jgi:hypothetical protein
MLSCPAIIVLLRLTGKSVAFATFLFDATDAARCASRR